MARRLSLVVSGIPGHTLKRKSLRYKKGKKSRANRKTGVLY
jgi:hypothetical protein